MKNMTAYEDALKMILENVLAMAEEKKPLLESIGQVLSEDIYSPMDLPRAPIAGPDGYALRAEDIKDASKETPAVLRIVGSARAGHPSEQVVEPGSAIRIMTGSVVPEGANCVVRFEDTDEPADKNGPNRNNPEEVKVYVSGSNGGNIRPVGSNIKQGTLMVPKGTTIGPSQVLAMASIGKTEVNVIRRPVIAIVATGDELVEPGQELSFGKVYNCNSATISAFVSACGGIPKVVGIARDRKEEIISKIRTGMTADAIITSGGVSKGDYDLLRIVLAEMGKVVFSRIKMGPGASVAFGLIHDESGKQVPVFSLSGPPIGCLVNLETLMRSALLKMRGVPRTAHPVTAAIAVDDAPGLRIPFAKYAGLAETDGKYQATISLSEKVGPLAAVAQADALAIIPEKSGFKAGDTIEVLPLSR